MLSESPDNRSLLTLFRIMSTPNPNGRILLVDDDPISLAQVEMLVSIEGFEVQTAQHPAEAIHLLLLSPSSFDAVLTDFMMPEINGIALMERAHQIDPTLSVIIITSDTERATLSSSIKGGAVDFLEKPVNRTHIRESLKRAVAKTADQRSMLCAANRLGTVTAIQQRLSPSFTHQTPQGMLCSMTTCLFPIHEAGGDFLSIFHDQQSRTSIALGDISGHGVREGFIGAYFQGLVKGMQMMGAPTDKIAEECNRFLMENWNSESLTEISTSLSATFVTLDLDSLRLNVANYGCPAPIFFSEGLPPQPLATSGSPLGWFDTPSGTLEAIQAPQSGSFFLWSDGIPDTAEKLKVSPFALAARVLIERSVPDRHEVPDDILVARIDWHPAHLPRPSTLPILHESLPGNSAGEVDSLDAKVKASISLAISGISSDLVDQIALCTREAVLNALNHGCLGSPALCALLLVEFFPATRTLRVTISDPGPGYPPRPSVSLIDIDSPADLETAGHISMGLQVIKSMATEIRFSRSGATIEMDFHCPG